MIRKRTLIALAVVSVAAALVASSQALAIAGGQPGYGS
jgi:hypothetical protein